MKIKFIKDYASVDPATNSGILHGFGETEEITEYTAQWLIDNGFAEKIEERWPRPDDKYWLVDTDGDIVCVKWENDEQDDRLKAIGNVFKTEKSAQRFADYLKAVETIRHDEGFMKQSRKIDYVPCGYGLYQDHSKSIVPSTVDCSAHAGEFYFDTYAHAQASLDKHRDEWQTILDYDWSKE